MNARFPKVMIVSETSQQKNIIITKTTPDFINNSDCDCELEVSTPIPTDIIKANPDAQNESVYKSVAYKRNIEMQQSTCK